jgi:hypothetical protein
MILFTPRLAALIRLWMSPKGKKRAKQNPADTGRSLAAANMVATET